MLGVGRIGEHLVADIAVVDDVVPQAEFLVDDRGQRLDAVGIDLAQLLHPTEDVVELGRQALELLVTHRYARELGDVPHLFVRN